MVGWLVGWCGLCCGGESVISVDIVSLEEEEFAGVLHYGFEEVFCGMYYGFEEKVVVVERK